MVADCFVLHSFERGVVGWYPAKVIFSLEEMVRVQRISQNETSKQDCWVEIESWKIARHGAHTNNEKMENFSYF